MSKVREILKKAQDGHRISLEEGVLLFTEANLFELGRVAKDLCVRRVPESQIEATFVVDRNINYTNYCNSLCKFCAFYRLPGDKEEGYVRGLDEIFQKIEELVAIGGTQVLLQGGHNPDLGIAYYEDLIAKIHARFPQVIIHSLSASEICHIAKVSNISRKEALERVRRAGMESLPGGGAEILVDRVRNRISPLKTKTADWVDVHRTAHLLGMKGTATMVYGFEETPLERMEHFEVVRKLQDETGGFRAFIPWSFVSESTEMDLPRRTGDEYLRMIALSRIMLDNILHIQAGWVTEGSKMAQVALEFGADDFGGILMEENVVTATGLPYEGVTKEEAIRLIREAGRIPVQRNTRYQKLVYFQESAFDKDTSVIYN